MRRRSISPTRAEYFWYRVDAFSRASKAKFMEVVQLVISPSNAAFVTPWVLISEALSAWSSSQSSERSAKISSYYPSKSERPRDISDQIYLDSSLSYFFKALITCFSMSSVILTGPLRAGSFMAKLDVSKIAIRTTFRIFLVIMYDVFFVKKLNVNFIIFRFS